MHWRDPYNTWTALFEATIQLISNYSVVNVAKGQQDSFLYQIYALKFNDDHL